MTGAADILATIILAGGGLFLALVILIMLARGALEVLAFLGEGFVRGLEAILIYPLEYLRRVQGPMGGWTEEELAEQRRQKELQG